MIPGIQNQAPNFPAAPKGRLSSEMIAILNRLLHLDANVSKVVLYRLWTMVAGVVVVVFVPRYLATDTQGYYYTFQSIVAMQVLFDLGLSQTISQVTSHEYAHVDTNTIHATATNARIAKLAYVKEAMFHWYRWMSGLFVLLVAVFGAGYFIYFGNGFAWSWFGPWIVLVLSTGINLALSPRIAMVEGAGWTGTIANLRLVQSVMGHALLVVCLVSGGRLWSIVAVPVTANIVSLAWLKLSHNPYRRVPAYLAGMYDHMPWRREIMGLQWRVAISWLGGYLGSQVIVPVAFAMRGPEEAGKIGLALQIFTAVQALGMSWISARIPLFGQLISRNAWPDLKRHFTKSTISATAVTATFALSVFIVLEIIRHEGLFLTHRIPSTFVIGALVFISIINTLLYALAAYMRAHKEEPLVLSSICTGVATVAAAVIGGLFGTGEIVSAYVIMNVAINLPWTVVLFRRYYRRDRMERHDA